MSSSKTGGRSFASLRSKARKTVSSESAELVTFTEPADGKTLPLLVQPAVKGVDILAWARDHRPVIDENLRRYGAILFKGFEVGEASTFERFIEAVCEHALEYKYRASPRTRVAGNIYTSTDYPPDQSIFPHNEHGYSPVFPLKIFFFAEVPPEDRGSTPIGSTRAILERIDPEVRERFARLGVMYVRNFGDGFGLPWQTVFQTEDPQEVERYCAEKGVACEWKEGGRLRTREVGPAIVEHPHTGEEVWFNHATFFHVTTLPASVQESLLRELDEEDLPTNTYYGDGSSIEPEVLEHLRAAYQDEMIAYPWERGDLLILDNMLAVHARDPYSGPRKILVGMAESYRRPELATAGQG